MIALKQAEIYCSSPLFIISPPCSSKLSFRTSIGSIHPLITVFLKNFEKFEFIHCLTETGENEPNCALYIQVENFDQVLSHTRPSDY